MRIADGCHCAFCDFDRRMADSDGKPVQWWVNEEFKDLVHLAQTNVVAFAYNMEEYVTVLLENGDEAWRQSYH